MRAVNALFAEVFEDSSTYLGAPPEAAYLDELLRDSRFIALAAVEDGVTVGALVAYELAKFEQARSEIYIYDLGVRTSHRRRGVATRLIDTVRRLAAQRGAWVVFVQADDGDAAPTALYSKLGRRESVLHFDMDPMAD